MKSNRQYLSLVVTAAVTLVGTAHAQYISGNQYLDNILPAGALYASWASGTVSTTPTGLRVQAAGYGSGYFIIDGADVQTLNASSALVQYTLTVNDGAPYPGKVYDWVGTPFTVRDDLPAPTEFNYGGYSGQFNGGSPASAVWSGNTLTWTQPLDPAQLAKVQTGTDHIYTFNLGFDPASIWDGENPRLQTASYDVTFNSIQFIAVPEPASMALAGLGIAALLVVRRRK